MPAVTPIQSTSVALEAGHKAACACIHQPAAQTMSSAATPATSQPDDLVKLDQDKVVGVCQQVPAAQDHARLLDAPLPPSEQLSAKVLNSNCEGTGRVSDIAQRQHSSIIHTHQHHLQERPAVSYSMPTLGVSKPPYAASSQGTHSVQRAATRGGCEGSKAADTDSPHAVRR